VKSILTSTDPACRLTDYLLSTADIRPMRVSRTGAIDECIDDFALV
jgi:hypothetical protein